MFVLPACLFLGLLLCTWKQHFIKTKAEYAEASGNVWEIDQAHILAESQKVFINVYSSIIDIMNLFWIFVENEWALLCKQLEINIILELN